jgi:AraC-like DNA-binding protein
MLPCKIPVGLRSALGDARISHREVLAAARLPSTLLDCPGARVAIVDYFSLWHALRAVSGDPNIGITLARSIKTELTEPLILAVLSAANVAAALEVVCAYKRQLSPEDVLMHRDDGARQVVLTWKWPPLQLPLPQALIDAELAFIVEMCRRCTRFADFKPLAVSLCASALEPGSQHADFFGCPLRLGATHHGLVIDAADLERPYLTFNPQLLNALLPYLEASTPRASDTLVMRVRQAIGERLQGQRPAARAVARELAMSTRAMQRTLKEEGTSFRQLLDEVRNQRARGYLQSTAFSDQEISFLLGFTDPNSFYRAFRSWTGRSPSEFRAKAP